MLQASHGESVVYLNRKTGVKRTITAIINRSPPARFDASGEVIAASLTAQVKDDATYGITEEQLNRGRDSIIVPVEQDGTPEERTITHLLEVGGGRLLLGIK